MSDQNDDNQNLALMVLAGLVGMVIAGVLTLAVSTASKGHAAKTAGPNVTLAAVSMTAEPDGRIYFDLASDALPPEATAVLVRVAEAARGSATRVVQISGYHDASGDAARNAELAKNRAIVVRQALVGYGVPADRLVMDKPIVATGGGDAREARRVELRLR
jgi:outer membrane protein OmpA-like peptidoglycan-associated protein